MVNARDSSLALELMVEAFEHSPMAMVIVDARGLIVMVNPALERLLGYGRNELFDESVEKLLPERLAASHRAQRESYAAQARARGMGAGRELCARHRDGHLIPVEIGLSPILSGSEHFVLSTLVDVSERRRLESELAQAQRQQTLGNLASSVAHDFNNFLLAILGYAELAQRDAMLHPETRANLDTIVETTLQARTFVKQVLNVARKDEPRREVIHWEPALGNVKKLLSLSLPANTTIEVSVAPQVAPVRADPMELQQILMNLLTNAMYAMKDKGGVIRVEVTETPGTTSPESGVPSKEPESQIRLRVIDEGEGMAADVLRRIFDPFFTTKPPGEGTGLGMAVIRRVVHDLGGTIDVDSREGCGTRVDVYLPARADDATTKRQQRSGKHPHILYVDDEERLAKLGRRVLEHAGFEVEVFTSSTEALREFQMRPESFDLVISDNRMQEMTGLELIERIAQIRPAIPVVIVSGAGDSVNADLVRALGIQRVIPKPFLFSELCLAVAEILNRPL